MCWTGRQFANSGRPIEAPRSINRICKIHLCNIKAPHGSPLHRSLPQMKRFLVGVGLLSVLAAVDALIVSQCGANGQVGVTINNYSQ